MGADAATIAFRGMWNVGNSVREGDTHSDEGSRPGNLKLIPTPSVVPRWKIFCRSFNILLFISDGQAGGLC